MIRKLILTASALALSACGAPETVLAQAPEYAAQEATASGPALWQVSDEDTTIYLFGTVHFLPEGLDWYNSTIEAALNESDQFVSEIDTSLIPEVLPGETPPPEVMAIAQMQMELAQLTTGGTLRDLMNEEDRAQYEAALGALGVPPAALDGFEPWMASMTLAQLGLVQAGIDPSTGVERTLDRLVEGKDRAALETIEQQLGFFDNLPLEAQLAMLDASVEAMPELSDGMQSMIAEWMEGDPAALAELINKEMDDPLLYETLLSNRNAAWAEWIETRLESPGTVFMAVGAGHLAGEGSVQHYLGDRGLTVERIEY